MDDFDSDLEMLSSTTLNAANSAIDVEKSNRHVPGSENSSLVSLNKSNISVEAAKSPVQKRKVHVAGGNHVP